MAELRHSTSVGSRTTSSSSPVKRDEAALLLLGEDETDDDNRDHRPIFSTTATTTITSSFFFNHDFCYKIFLTFLALLLISAFFALPSLWNRLVSYQFFFFLSIFNSFSLSLCVKFLNWICVSGLLLLRFRMWGILNLGLNFTFYIGGLVFVGVYCSISNVGCFGFEIQITFTLVLCLWASAAQFRMWGVLDLELSFIFTLVDWSLQASASRFLMGVFRIWCLVGSKVCIEHGFSLFYPEVWDL